MEQCVRKVLDFGLAKVTDAPQSDLDDEALTQAKVTTDPGLVIGTPRYMSPEQARGLKVDSRTDVFSLGVVLYEMLAGRPPFDGINSLDLIGAILNLDPQPLGQHAPDVPVELERIIFKCLEKDREVRYQSARDLADDLHRLKGVVATDGYTPAGKRIGSAGSKKWWPLAAAAVILAAIATFSLFYFRRTPAGSSEIRTLAVLPLAIIGNEPGPNYLGLGIADTIITKISRLDGLIVRPTSAIRRYSNHQTEALQAAHEQQVDAVLDGTIQQNGDRLRISFNLIRTSDGTSLWADQFDLDFIEIFGLQDKVARQIVERLRYRISAAEKDKVAKNHTNNPEAYDNYLKATYYFSDRKNFWWERGEIDKAVDLLTKAVKLDPGFALAHVLLGSSYVHIATWHEENPDLIRRATIELEIAEKLDRQLADIHILRSYIFNSHYKGYQFEESLKAIGLAQQISPNTGRVALGRLYQHMGFKEAYREYERALELEPASDEIKNDIISTYLSDIDPEGALSAMKRFSLNEKWVYFRGVMAWAYLDRKMTEEASPYISSYYKAGRDALNLYGLKMALESKHQQAEATITKDWVRRKIPPITHPTYHHFAHNAARIYALQGKSEEAVKWLRISAEEGFPNYPAFSRDPYLDGIRKHPDFVRFMADLKIRWEGYRRLFLDN